MSGSAQESRSLPGSQGLTSVGATNGGAINGAAIEGEGDPQHCPVLLKAGGVRACPSRLPGSEACGSASQGRLERMRLFRRAVLTCQSCEARWRCGFLPLFNASIEAAIAEVSQEWGLGAS